jgi:antitoxin VapB
MPYFYRLRSIFYQGEAMGAQPNIKSEDAYRLADLSGETPTTAVTKALRTEFDRELRPRDKAALRARLMALADEISASMPADVTSDHSWLYDAGAGLLR